MDERHDPRDEERDTSMGGRESQYHGDNQESPRNSSSRTGDHSPPTKYAPAPPIFDSEGLTAKKGKHKKKAQDPGVRPPAGSEGNRTPADEPRAGVTPAGRGERGIDRENEQADDEQEDNEQADDEQEDNEQAKDVRRQLGRGPRLLPRGDGDGVARRDYFLSRADVNRIAREWRLYFDGKGRVIGVTFEQKKHMPGIRLDVYWPIGYCAELRRRVRVQRDSADRCLLYLMNDLIVDTFFDAWEEIEMERSADKHFRSRCMRRIDVIFNGWARWAARTARWRREDVPVAGWKPAAAETAQVRSFFGLDEYDEHMERVIDRLPFEFARAERAARLEARRDEERREAARDLTETLTTFPTGRERHSGISDGTRAADTTTTTTSDGSGGEDKAGIYVEKEKPPAASVIPAALRPIVTSANLEDGRFKCEGRGESKHEDQRGDGDNDGSRYAETYARVAEAMNDLIDDQVLEDVEEIVREVRRDERRSEKQTRNAVMGWVVSAVIDQEVNTIVGQELQARAKEGDRKREGLRVVMGWLRGCGWGARKNGGDGMECITGSGAGDEPQSAESRAVDGAGKGSLRAVGKESSGRWMEFWERVCGDVTGENERMAKCGEYSQETTGRVALCQRRWRGSRGFRYHARLRASGRAYRERG